MSLSDIILLQFDEKNFHVRYIIDQFLLPDCGGLFLNIINNYGVIQNIMGDWQVYVLQRIREKLDCFKLESNSKILNQIQTKQRPNFSNVVVN